MNKSLIAIITLISCHCAWAEELTRSDGSTEVTKAAISTVDVIKEEQGAALISFGYIPSTNVKSDIDAGLPLTDALAIERIILEPLISAADLIIDTSEMSPYNQREVMQQRFGKARSGMAISIESFGFKKGAPLNADIVLDMRMLANPHWEPELRAFTGQALQVKQFIEAHPETVKDVGLLIDVVFVVELHEHNEELFL